MCEICSNLIIKTPERRHRRRSGGVFIIRFEQISHITEFENLNDGRVPNLRQPEINSCSSIFWFQIFTKTNLTYRLLRGVFRSL